MMLAYVGQAPMQWRTVKLRDVLTQTQPLLYSMLPKTTAVRIANDDTDATVYADDKLLGQVVVNLVTNASESLPPTGGEVLITLGEQELDETALSQLANGEELTSGCYGYLQVSDCGTGISPEVMERMFDPFYSTKETGRGLGLAACFGIARLHAGGYAVHSSDRGTTVRFYLPLTKVA